MSSILAQLTKLPCLEREILIPTLVIDGGLPVFIFDVGLGLKLLNGWRTHFFFFFSADSIMQIGEFSSVQMVGMCNT